jgi:hypothetical protein
MNNIYKDFKEGRPLNGLARVSAILIMIMVWILIDKGNIYGQDKLAGDVISADVQKLSMQQAPLLRGGDDSGDADGDIIDESDEGTDFQVYPNPVKHDLVFDFEFTVRETIPYEVFNPLGRLIARGEFEAGISTQSLDFSRMQSGMYIIRLDIGGKTKISRVIRE